MTLGISDRHSVLDTVRTMDGIWALDGAIRTILRGIRHIITVDGMTRGIIVRITGVAGTVIIQAITGIPIIVMPKQKYRVLLTVAAEVRLIRQHDTAHH